MLFHYHQAKWTRGFGRSAIPDWTEVHVQCTDSVCRLQQFYAANWLILASFDPNFVTPEISVNQVKEDSAFMLGGSGRLFMTACVLRRFTLLASVSAEYSLGQNDPALNLHSVTCNYTARTWSAGVQHILCIMRQFHGWKILDRVGTWIYAPFICPWNYLTLEPTVLIHVFHHTTVSIMGTLVGSRSKKRVIF